MGLIICIIFLIGIILCRTITVQAESVDDEMDRFQYPRKDKNKIAYLTFDDGPSSYTKELLEILEKEQVPAIFFVIGENFTVQPNGKELVKEMYDKGHYIGLHSMTHDRNKLYLTANAPQNFMKEMMEVKALIAEATEGFQSELCRPPYGSKAYFTKAHYAIVKDSNLKCWDWNIDSMDWSGSSPAAILAKVKKDLESTKYPDVTVLLFHEKKNTVKILPEVIQYYREQGYEFVSYHPADEVQFSNKQIYQY
ncbi:MAG TPA: polysaccharide deacetylase [Firmicutes bacterium]|nr:polysaccharide deacetylase [Bacillota bacterium]